MKKAFGVLVGTVSIAAAGVVYFQTFPHASSNLKGNLSMDNSNPGQSNAENSNAGQSDAKKCYDQSWHEILKCDDTAKKGYEKCSKDHIEMVLRGDCRKDEKCVAKAGVLHEECRVKVSNNQYTCALPYWGALSKCLLEVYRVDFYKRKAGNGENCISGAIIGAQKCNDKRLSTMTEAVRVWGECMEKCDRLHPDSFADCKEQCDSEFSATKKLMWKETSICEEEVKRQKESCMKSYTNPKPYTPPKPEANREKPKDTMEQGELVPPHSNVELVPPPPERMSTPPDSGDSMMAPE